MRANKHHTSQFTLNNAEQYFCIIDFNSGNNTFTLENVQILVFYAVQYEYKTLARQDCFGNDIHSQTVHGGATGPCVQWCSNNDHCQGFTVFRSTCYFKSYACGNNITTVQHSATLYLKQGKSGFGKNTKCSNWIFLPQSYFIIQDNQFWNCFCWLV